MGKAGFGVHEVPNPSVVTKKNIDITAPIPVAPGIVLSTAPAIKGGDVTKIIMFTVNVDLAGGDDIMLHLDRDGTEINVTDVYDETATPVGHRVLSMHWVDENPGKGAPVYAVRATSIIGAGTVANSRRITVHNG